MKSAPWSAVRPLVTALVIGVALVAQQLTNQPRSAGTGWILFAAAAIVGALAAWRQEQPRPPVTWAGPVVHRRRLIWLGGGAIAAGATCTYLSAQGRWPVLALALWIVGFGLASGALRGSLVTPPAREVPPWSRAEYAVLAALLILGAAARTLWLDAVPRYYFDDEPRVGVFLMDAFHDRIPNFFTMGWNSWPVIGMALQGVFAPFFGLDTTTLRLSSALSGTLAVLTTYLLARHLFSPRVAVLSTLLFACGRTAIDFSRLGVCHAQVLLFETLAFFFFWRAVNSGRGTSYCWAGIGLGLCLYTYNAGQVVPVLWIGWLMLALLFAPRMALTHWRGAVITAAALLLTYFPYLFYATDHFTFGRNWVEYTGMARSRQVMSQVVDAWRALGPSAGIEILKNQALRTWLGFGVLPADAYALGYRGGGMLDHVSAPLFVLGLAMCVLNITRARYAFVLFWWLVTTVAGGVFTEAPPAFVRLVGILPALALLAALPLDALLEACAGARQRTIAAVAGIGILLLAAGWDNWRTYFVLFPRDTTREVSELARAAQQLPSNATVLLVGSEHFLQFNYELFQLNFRGRHLEDVAEPAQLLPLRYPANGPIALAFAPTQLTLANYARTLYSDATVTDVRYGADPGVMFRLMRIEPEQIAARQALKLEAYDRANALQLTTVADPFADVSRLPGRYPRLRWSGSLYWPTDQPAKLTVKTSGNVSLTLAGQTLPEVRGTAPVTVALQLPQGWHPLRLDEQPGDARSLSISIEHRGHIAAITARDCRPDGEDEGLLAVYTRRDQPILRTIESQLNSYAVEDLFRPPNDVSVRMPFSVSWAGTLEIEQPGTYEFEAYGSGPYVLSLDGQTILQQAVSKPEEPRSARVLRTLSAGSHPIAAAWDSTRRAHTSRRIFQVYWKAPGSERELIPPSRFRHEPAQENAPALPTITVPPTPTPISLGAEPRTWVSELPARDITFGFAAPKVDRTWSGAPIEMWGVPYAHGIGMHAWTRMTYTVPQGATEFQAIVGLSDGVKECSKASVTFEVRDQRDAVLYDSGVVDVYAQPKLIRVPVQGTDAITLAVTDAGDGIDCDHANWAEPSFLLQR